MLPFERARVHWNARAPLGDIARGSVVPVGEAEVKRRLALVILGIDAGSSPQQRLGE